jgi:hypothetical protein
MNKLIYIFILNFIKNIKDFKPKYRYYASTPDSKRIKK